jgi:hypothetical protein
MNDGMLTTLHLVARQEKYDALWAEEFQADQGKGCLEHLAKGKIVCMYQMCM